MQSTGGVADCFAPLAARLERRLPGGLPFAVRFWDDSELRPEGEGSGDTIVVRDLRALSYIATAPNQVGLGRAWVAGDLELDGDLERALRACELLRGLRLDLGDRIASLRAAAPRRRSPAPPPGSAARLRRRARLTSPGVFTRSAATAPPFAITTTSRTSSTAWCWARRWSAHAPTSTPSRTPSSTPRSESSMWSAAS
jgi:hypothetical protein